MLLLSHEATRVLQTKVSGTGLKNVHNVLGKERTVSLSGEDKLRLQQILQNGSSLPLCILPVRFMLSV
jgi:hypothetical protein